MVIFRIQDSGRSNLSLHYIYIIYIESKHHLDSTTTLTFIACMKFTLFYALPLLHFKWHSKMPPCWLLASFPLCYPIQYGLYNLSLLISVPLCFSFLNPSGLSFLSPAQCVIYSPLICFNHFHRICGLSKFAVAEMEGGGGREVGGANDRIWARCRRNSWRCRVASPHCWNKYQNGKRWGREGRQVLWHSDIKSGSWLMSHLIPFFSCRFPQ